MEKQTWVVLAFAFGAPSKLWSNRTIAEIASKEARRLETTIYTQLDVRPDSDLQVRFTPETFDDQPSTLRIALNGVLWALGVGATDIMIVAAGPHMWRAVRDTLEALREFQASDRIKVHACSEALNYPEERWFNITSEQSRTRTKENWEKRERILRKLPFVLYRLVAK